MSQLLYYDEIRSKLVLIRHSVPEIDPSQPPDQWKLNDIGKKQARLMARQLSTQSVSNIMSSIEPKAIETAQIIADFFVLATEIVPVLHEHVRPHAGLTSEQSFRKTIARLFARPDDLTFGSETANEASSRYERAIRNLLRR